jgi:hypothetical protein
MALVFNIDVASIVSELKEFKEEVSQDLKKSAGNLAVMTHAKVSEMAQEELHSSREQFLKSLSFEEIAEGIWVVAVDESGLWIEEGMKNHDMKLDLLKNNTKTSKDGHKYKTIPFDYGKTNTQMTPKTQEFVNYLKQSLKKEKVPYRKIERNPDGSPRIGKLHSFNFGNPRGTMGGPGKGNTPVFQGVSIYQSMTKSGSVKRDIMTFRTVTDGPKSDGKWEHPGLEGHKFLDKALEWCTTKFEEEILPEILKKYE